MAALEDRIEADLALGRTDLVGELEALVAQHPSRERLRRQLMLTLYRSGRQAEALDAYHQTRRALVEELGIEPGKALRDLELIVADQHEQFPDLPEAPALDSEGARFRLFAAAAAFLRNASESRPLVLLSSAVVRGKRPAEDCRQRAGASTRARSGVLG